MKKLILTAFVACSVGLACAESGNVETVSHGIISNSLTLDYGNSKSSTAQTRGAAKVMQSDVSFFPLGRVTSFECFGVNSSDGTNQSGTSQCLITDSDGDKLRQNFVRTEATPKLVKGTVDGVGLTGKYLGMTGIGTYELQLIQNNGYTYSSTVVKMKVTK